MRSLLRILLILFAVVPVWAAPKPHVVVLGKVQAVRVPAGPDETQTVSINVRPLLVDGKVKEYTTGPAHDVTDRLFVVQRAYRLNDSLSGDTAKQPAWIWQRGGWMLVDRVSGHATQLKLPDFDTGDSEVAWYRDFAAYCGISEKGDRGNAIVWQIGARKAVYRKELSGAAGQGGGSACGTPRWERTPPRVTFVPRQGDAFTINVTSRHASELPEAPDED